MKPKAESTGEIQNLKKERKEESPEDCEHEWKPVGTTHHQATLELVCVKCGAKKEIELFP